MRDVRVRIQDKSNKTDIVHKGLFNYYVIHFRQFLDPNPSLLCGHHILILIFYPKMDNCAD